MNHYGEGSGRREEGLSITGSRDPKVLWINSDIPCQVPSCGMDQFKGTGELSLNFEFYFMIWTDAVSLLIVQQGTFTVVVVPNFPVLMVEHRPTHHCRPQFGHLSFWAVQCYLKDRMGCP